MEKNVMGHTCCSSGKEFGCGNFLKIGHLEEREYWTKTKY